jgi:hypothetical protein
MWKLGLWPRNSFSGNICFEFLVSVLCSVDSKSALAWRYSSAILLIFRSNVTTQTSPWLPLSRQSLYTYSPFPLFMQYLLIFYFFVDMQLQTNTLSVVSRRSRTMQILVYIFSHISFVAHFRFLFRGNFCNHLLSRTKIQCTVS